MTEAEITKKLEKDEMYRAGGECVCSICGKTYDRHKNCEGKYYWLTELCNGDLVKL